MHSLLVDGSKASVSTIYTGNDEVLMTSIHCEATGCREKMRVTISF